MTLIIDLIYFLKRTTVKTKILFYSFLLMLAFGINATISAQDTGQITGGYGDTSVADKDVKSAAAFAVKTRTRQSGKSVALVKVVKAEVQVVAGLNYRICMKVRQGGKTQTVTAVVYKDLSNRRQLSRWKSGGCTEL